MDAVVRLALARQPLPEAALALERSGVNTSAVLVSMSPMLAGCSIFDYAIQCSDDFAVASLTEREVEGEVATPGAARTTSDASRVPSPQQMERVETKLVDAWRLIDRLRKW